MQILPQQTQEMPPFLRYNSCNDFHKLTEVFL